MEEVGLGAGPGVSACALCTARAESRIIKKEINRYSEPVHSYDPVMENIRLNCNYPSNNLN